MSEHTEAETNLPPAYEHSWGSLWERTVVEVVWRELGQIVRPEHFEAVVKGIASGLAEPSSSLDTRFIADNAVTADDHTGG